MTVAMADVIEKTGGRLSIVATPIGNLEDITLRALRTLKEADIILCEDTRITKKLLAAHAITTPTLSFHAHSNPATYEKILRLLQAGKRIALVVDAGTPGISDPGGELVAEVRAHVPEIKIEAIPGPSALTAALSVAGLRTRTFVFYGFLPHKKGRATMLKTLARDERAAVLYESPHRIKKLLSSLELLAPGRTIALCKELTKVFETVFVGTPKEALAFLEEDALRAKGEFVVVVEAL